MVERQPVQVATSREVPSIRASMHSTSLLVINSGWTCSGTCLQSASSASCSRLISCQPCSCSGTRRTRTVQLLSGLILARCLTSPQRPTRSHHSCIPELQDGNVHCSVELDITNFKRVICKIHSDDAFSVAIRLAWPRLSRPLVSPICCLWAHVYPLLAKPSPGCGVKKCVRVMVVLRVDLPQCFLAEMDARARATMAAQHPTLKNREYANVRSPILSNMLRAIKNPIPLCIANVGCFTVSECEVKK